MRNRNNALAVGVFMALALVAGACSFDTGQGVGVYTYATYTPAATGIAQATPTHTPAAEATPTQEVIATPSVYPTVPHFSCAVKLGPDNIRLREMPTTGATVIDVLERASVQRVYIWRQGDVYLWARTDGGWFAARQNDWWVYGLEGQSEICVDVTGWPGGDLMPPEPIVETPTEAAFLIHVEVGTSADELAQMYAVLDAHGGQSGVKAVNTLDLCAHALANGQICVSRDLLSGDCPNVLASDPAGEALRWMRVIEPRVFPDGIRPTMIEVANECNYDDLEWWNAFMIKAIELGELWDWPPLILPSMPPGHKESHTITAWKPALTALRDSGGCMGMHAYGIYRGLAESDIFTGYRHRLVRAFLVGAGLGDLDICITEAAAADGYQAPDLEDFAAWYADIKSDPHLRFVAAYHAGLGRGVLSDLRGRLVELAQVVG